MKISQTQKIIFIVLVFALAGFILYKTFFSSGTTASVSVVSTDTSGTTATTTGGTEGQDILNLAEQFSTISIDPSLFSSPLFQNLKDFDTPLSPELQGRPNPFATIGIDISGAGQSVLGSTTTSH